MKLTLTLNRQWFDRIAEGSKNIEYRKDSPFYERLFRDPKKWTEIVFHFYRRERLHCKIVTIKKINRPNQFRKSEYLTTKKVWAIRVSNPKTYLAAR